MATQSFREWLVEHEVEIADGENGLGALREEFAAVIGRAARAAESDVSVVAPAPEAPRESTDLPTGGFEPAIGE